MSNGNTRVSSNVLPNFSLSALVTFSFAIGSFTNLTSIDWSNASPTGTSETSSGLVIPLGVETTVIVFCGAVGVDVGVDGVDGVGVGGVGVELAVQ
jgi:hypothetical protein